MIHYLDVKLIKNVATLNDTTKPRNVNTLFNHHHHQVPDLEQTLAQTLFNNYLINRKKNRMYSCKNNLERN